MFGLRVVPFLIRPSRPLAMRVLCVAEKPSIARSITDILSGGHFDTVSEMLPPHTSTNTCYRIDLAVRRASALIIPKQTHRSPSPTSQAISLSSTFPKRIGNGTLATRSRCLRLLLRLSIQNASMNWSETSRCTLADQICS